MPIVRTYQCGECFHRIEVTLAAEQWDDPPPSCPECERREMQQQFKPFAINGSPHAKAAAMADDIIANDYHAADFNRDRHEGSTPTVRYKDQTPDLPKANWQAIGREALEMAIANGRQTRLAFGSGLDVLQANLKSGAQPDLIEVSKRRSARIW
jgi:putative FmdB family regulatory protein